MPSPVDNLAPALVQTFVVVLLGYWSGRSSGFSDGAKFGMEYFVTRITLPALFFLGVARLDFSNVNWAFFFAVLVAKSFVFVVVVVLTIFSTGGESRSCAYLLAGIRGLFVTLQNDFALGLPLFQALYGDTHPTYITLIYLAAPINICVLNPLAIFLLELGQPEEGDDIASEGEVHPLGWRSEEEDAVTGGGAREGSLQGRGPEEAGLAAPLLRRVSSSSGSENGGSDSDLPSLIPLPLAQKVLMVLKNLATTPVLFVVPLALVANFAFEQKVPTIIAAPLEVMGDGYTCAALFAVGLSMSTQSQSKSDPPVEERDVIMAFLLIFTKVIALPTVALVIFMLLDDDKEMAIAVFIYGTFPTAPSVTVFASNYGISTK
ncbi:hypothetical protein CYMTET_26910, partial [Cymbomonas tetramitiformis]